MNEALHWCEDKDTLVEYLYGELDVEARRVFEGHLRTCVPCAREVEELQGIRHDLAGWLPPESELGFTITQKSVRVQPTSVVVAQSATVLQPPAWAWASVPAWARAAAAVLVIGAGMGLANVQIHSNADGLSVSTGWMTPAAPAPARVAASETAVVPTSAAWRPELAALEADLRKEMQSMRAESSAVAPVAVSRTASSDDQAVLRRVQSLIQDSEKRHQQQIALQLRQFGSDVELQRRVDLARFEQGIDRFQGRSGAAIAQQQRVLDLLVRASTTKVP